ncbi:hypothetical protein Emag_001967 [Eimeria magna]
MRTLHRPIMHLFPLFLVHFVATICHELSGYQAVTSSGTRVPYKEGFLHSQYSRDSPRSTFFVAPNKAKRSLLAQKSFDTSWGSAREDHVAQLRAFDALKRWLTENGALLDVHGLALKPRSHAGQCALVSLGEATESRGLTAARAYRRGELLASIPTRLSFDLELLEQFVVGATGEQAVMEHEASSHHDTEEEPTSFTKADQSICLALPLALFQLLHSENLNSRLPLALSRSTCRGIPLARLYEGWLLYVRLLKPPPETIPLFWKAAEVRALEHPIASSVFERHFRLQRSVPRFELRVREIFSLQGAHSAGLDSKTLSKRLLSAYATTVSRTVRMLTAGRAFVPLIDLCDHAAEEANARLTLSASSVQTVVNNKPEGSFNSDYQRCCNEGGFIQLVATKDISPGDQIRVPYGNFDTATLLLNYGLLPSVNPHDKIEVEFSPRRVRFALRAIGVERLMVADDFSFLGPRVVRRLAKLGLTAFGTKCERAHESACVKHAPFITVRGDAKPDERLIAAAKILAAHDYDEVNIDDQRSGASEVDYQNSVKAKSKLDLMVFITNVFFPRQEPPEYKQKFQRGGCPRWLLDPRKGTPDLTKDWLPADGWSYDLASQVIEYRGSEEAKEPAHAFPFSLFLPRRASTRFALIKRDFFCQGTQIQSTIMLNGAKEAGLVFRGVGERNFWAVMLTLGGGINLLRVKNGEKQNLGSVGGFLVQVLEGQEPVKFSRQQEKEEEVRPKNYEDCAFGGLQTVCCYEIISEYLQLRELQAS